MKRNKIICIICMIIICSLVLATLIAGRGLEKEYVIHSNEYFKFALGENWGKSIDSSGTDLYQEYLDRDNDMHLIFSNDDNIKDQQDYDRFVREYWEQLETESRKADVFCDLHFNDRTVDGIPVKEISYVEKENYFNAELFFYLDDRMITASFRCKCEDKAAFDTFVESIEMNNQGYTEG